VSDADQNLRINPNNGVAIVDGALNPAPIDLIGSAYTNNFAGATATSLFGIDALTASLMRSTAPNAGTYVSVGSLGLGPIGSDARIGFDIVGRRNAFHSGARHLGDDDLRVRPLRRRAASDAGEARLARLTRLRRRSLPRRRRRRGSG
jgi:hypothetical protein